MLVDSDLTLAWGRRYGLVGMNGCGKTTLMTALASRLHPFDARDVIPPGIGEDILLVQQEVPADDRSALDTVVSSDTQLLALRGELERLENENENEMVDWEKVQERIVELYEELDSIGSDYAEQRASAILSGLQFSEEEKGWPTRHFSGGWRMRIALAQALFRQPRLLLLDEPTNHLDLHGVIWLEDFLSSYPCTLVVVSHDRDFLTTVTTDIYHIHSKRLYHYRGNYGDFETLFSMRIAKSEKMSALDKKKRKKLQQKGGGAAAVAAGAGASKNKKKLLKKKQQQQKNTTAAQDIIELVPESKMHIDFSVGQKVPMPMVSIKGASFGYGDKPDLFTDLDCGISMEDRIAIVGANGSGKSTLLKLMSGEIDPRGGEVEIGRKVRIGVYSQHSSSVLDLDKTPCKYLMDKYPELGFQEARNMLGRFGLPGDLAVREIRTLSGGEKARVVFVELGLRNLHVLLLDEPTNHLDLDTVDCLTQALHDFKGGVVLVTHNMSLIDRVCSCSSENEAGGQIWVVGDGDGGDNNNNNNKNDIILYDGSIRDYRDEIEQEFRDHEKEIEEEARKRMVARKEERERKLKEKMERINNNKNKNKNK